MAKDLLDALRRNALKSRSGLREWLFDHYEELKPVMSKPRAPWLALAQTAADNGYRKADGKPYSRQTLREAWKAVEADDTARPAAPATRSPPSVRPVGTVGPTPPLVQPEPAEQARPRLKRVHSSNQPTSEEKS
jgi:hypothetical protein